VIESRESRSDLFDTTFFAKKVVSKRSDLDSSVAYEKV